MTFKYIVFISYADIDYNCYFGKARGGMLIEEATRGGYLFRFEMDDLLGFLVEHYARAL